MSGCKNKERKILGEESEILEGWIEHFKELLNNNNNNNNNKNNNNEKKERKRKWKMMKEQE
jgi:hypothetical protein